jgi:protein-ribulosamine 3-kinase
MNNPEQFYEKVIEQEIGPGLVLKSHKGIGGGCIHNGVRLILDKGSYFLKWNDTIDLDMFETEALGLEFLRKISVINIPEVIGIGTINGTAYLLMNFIEPAPRSESYWEDFGSKLAQLHQKSNEYFGLDHDNYIGSLPQENNFKSNWIDFFIDLRLDVMLTRASKKGLVDTPIIKKFEQLYAKLPSLILSEKPSLLHGDLWSGNVLVGMDGQVALIDPAVYFGHREVELAFTGLFGGFDRRFYQAYNDSFSLQPGYEDRFEIYNLYPLLVHLNLFGSSYLSGIKHVLNRFLN